MNHYRCRFLLHAVLCMLAGMAGMACCLIDGTAQEESGAADSGNADGAALTASELLQAGIEAFDRQNFVEAERVWEQLETDFGESEEVQAELLRLRPLLAIAKVAKGEFVEALGLKWNILISVPN